jgi:hypothetical protein
MTRRQKLVLALAAIHFALIGLKAFGNLKRGTSFLRDLPRLSFVVENVTEVAVLQADYGFFSPNVASGNRIKIQAVSTAGDSTDVALRLPSNEIGLRFHTSMTVFRAIKMYRELVARSLAAKAYVVQPDAALVVVSAYDQVLPTRAEYRAARRPEQKLFFQAVFSTSRGRDAGLAPPVASNEGH